MKQFTRHTFRTKCNINFHHFFLRSADTIVLAFLITYIHTSHMFRVIYDGWRTCNINFCIVFFCFLVTEPSVRGSEYVERRRTTHLSCDTTAVTSSCCIWLATLLPSHLHAAFVLPHYRRHIFILHLSCHTTAVTSSCCIFLDSPLFNFKTVGFLNSVGQFFFICPCNATAVHFLFQ